jgi:hypothetical protein
MFVQGVRMKRATFCFVATLVLTPQTASAQSFWMDVARDVSSQAIANGVANGPMRFGSHEDERRCLAGEPALSESGIERARESISETMNDYWRLAAATDSANVEGVYSRTTKSDAWRLNGEGQAIQSITDPLARAATNSASLPVPEAISVSGDRRTARAIWHVQDADGVSLGFYQAVFVRNRNDWPLMALEVLPGEQQLVALGAYCHVPGDVEAHLASYDADGNFIGSAAEQEVVASVVKTP